MDKNAGWERTVVIITPKSTLTKNPTKARTFFFFTIPTISESAPQKAPINNPPIRALMKSNVDPILPTHSFFKNT